MSQISEVRNPWRDMLMEQASFRGLIFHVETGARLSGRRTVVHEYPKRNDPYAEDMGRQARRFHFAGYLIYRPGNPLYEYTRQRVLLYNALEEDGPGWLIHPVFCPGGRNVMCERYTMVESRTRGGFSEFEMQFVEAGQAGNSVALVNTVAQVAQAAANIENAAKAAMNSTATDLWSRGAQVFSNFGLPQ